MATARESLLRAAEAALAARPWPEVRMVEVAAAAGVSRQSLYNEFGDKEGLGHALIRRAADRYLDGVDRALTPGEAGADAAPPLAALAEWTVRAARARPLVRALLTGAWSPALPAPPPPGGRRPLGPGELVRAVRDRAAAPAPQDAWRCELAVRLALSYVVAPGEEEGTRELLRLLTSGPVSAPNRTAEGR
ncbi:TetR/AcrR family transcriptional regulator [Streptomyces sp. RerS4]|uniref:TetR/AcrR family transcriptional regulator n=1 Tax=Streptomyces sp. RerS4 TaxID=2942449 RepID=UPI00201BAA8C|nr:TetR/AcrR family transcriptional regulator [Streptomyces sp. RerS4]UQX02903.1 TetR/AcrR family transcriptional regulator [Streptomyces sp. RerS4]